MIGPFLGPRQAPARGPLAGRKWRSCGEPFTLFVLLCGHSTRSDGVRHFWSEGEKTNKARYCCRELLLLLLLFLFLLLLLSAFSAPESLSSLYLSFLSRFLSLSHRATATSFIIERVAQYCISKQWIVLGAAPRSRAARMPLPGSLYSARYLNHHHQRQRRPLSANLNLLIIRRYGSRLWPQTSGPD